jgi:hypothetical protein
VDLAEHTTLLRLEQQLADEAAKAFGGGHDDEGLDVSNRRLAVIRELRRLELEAEAAS